MTDRKDHFLEKFLFPKSVAVVGVSKSPSKGTHHLLANMVRLGFKGKLFPVNPSGGEILGLKVYENLMSIEESVDLVIVGVPQQLTLQVVKDCVAKGVKHISIVAGGFSETGEAGKQMQEEMNALVKQNGIRTMGPNCLGPINTETKLIISFLPAQKLGEGGISLIFQSGLYEPRMGWMFSEFNYPLGKLVDLGNKMDISEVEALTYYVLDPGTRVVGIHMESMAGDGREFMKQIRKGAADKHIVILKSGRTKAGAKAVASHTGAIVKGSDIVFDSALRQAGAIRAQNIEEFFDLTRVMERFGDLRLNGNRVALATLPGGEAVVSTDILQDHGFTMPDLEEATRDKLRPIFPPWDIGGNPFDLGVSLQMYDPVKVYSALMEALADDPNIDALAVMLLQKAEELPRAFFEIFPKALRNGKPIVLWLPGIPSGRSENLAWVESQRIPILPGPEKAIKSLAALRYSSRYKS